MKSYARTNQYKIPRGRVAFARRRADGSYEGFEFFGNCPEQKLTVETENYEHENFEEGVGQIDLNVPIKSTRASTFKCDNLSLKVLAKWWGSGSIGVFTTDTTPVTDEIFYTLPDQTFQLGLGQNISGVRGITGTTLTTGGTTRANSTAYTKGTVIIPATPNNHLYLVSAVTTGISAGSLPTYPTDGSSVVDGGITLLDLGSIASLIALTDYVFDTDLGLVSIPIAGKIGAAAYKGFVAMGDDAINWLGIPILADYTPLAATRQQIMVSAGTTIRGRLKFWAANPYGEDQDLLIPDTILGPSGELSLIGEATASVVDFSAAINKLDSDTPYVVYENRSS